MASKKVSSITVVGVGQVGGAVAYALILSSCCDQLLLVDTDIALIQAQEQDLSDTAHSSGSRTWVRTATHREGSESDIVVITAGSKYSRGETRLQHMHRNVAIMRAVMEAMTPFGPETIVLVVSNPVDLLASIALKLSKLPHNRVLGSGTFLDSVRVRALIADKAKVSENSIESYVLGLHGESQVIAWSSATVGGIPLDKAVMPGTIDEKAVAAECENRSLRIIRAKGSMPFGIGSVVASICSSILSDKRDVCPISHYQPDFGCCFSTLVVVGRRGVEVSLPVSLNEHEKAEIVVSAKQLRDAVSHLDGS